MEWYFWVWAIGWFLWLVALGGYMADCPEAGIELPLLLVIGAFWPVFVPFLAGMALHRLLEGQ